MMDAKSTTKDAINAVIVSRRTFLKKENGLVENGALALMKTGFGNQINLTLISLMDKYSNPQWQSDALEVISSSPIYERVDEIEARKEEGFSYMDQLVKELLKWFKEDFFKWVNKPHCDNCGNDDEATIQGERPTRPYTKEHFEGHAGVIERYRCQKCGTSYEFPRFNNPAYLLKTRQGRCGEWNNCFILLLVTLGLDVRYLWNAEDHVWCEYFSTNLKRWIHLDSCENAFDNPLLYNAGWGKKMSYTFAIHKHYILDVSKKYLDTAKPDKHLPRNKMNARELQLLLTYINTKRIGSVKDDGDFIELTSRLICDYHSLSVMENPSTLSKVPRQSGDLVWTAARGENGI